MMRAACVPTYRGRRLLLLLALAVGVVALLYRAVYLHVFNKDFLQRQGNARHLRVITLPAHRGMITDRNGEPLAVSTPVDSVWANPKDFSFTPQSLAPLAQLLAVDAGQIAKMLAERRNREFVYIKRHVHPGLAQQVMALNLPGIDLQREYRRYYPAGEVTAHILGFTNIDDVGQEGLELAYDEWLRGTPGAKRALKDGKNRIVEDVESLRPAQPGHELALSVDRRLQYLAYRELKTAVREHAASSGSAVILDAQSGAILAMVSQPSYNPNSRSGRAAQRLRNRSLTDVFEPGSTIKPFTVACALENGPYVPATPIDTTPGRMRIGRKVIRDVHNYGLIDVATVISKSSNVGAAKIALTLPPQTMWSLFDELGFGKPTGIGFPGEAAGMVTDLPRWKPLERATLSFGYGLSVTPLQLAKAYAVLANDGLRPVLTLLHSKEQVPAQERLLSGATVTAVRSMLEAAVSDAGTGKFARVAGYRVAGKTGTVRSSIAGGYSTRDYISVFAGMAPASRPRLVMVVMIKEPRKGQYYGGLVAAPVFGRVMSDALRLLNIAPDGMAPIEKPVLLHTGVPGALKDPA